MIISLFGPDGVGKSSLAKLFSDDGFQVFSGTGVALWPDKSWINELNAKGLDETRIDDENHFLEKIKRAHTLARSLEKTNKVVIDSDPLHKTLMHDLLKHGKGNQRKKLESRFRQLANIADIDNRYVHVHMQISENLSDKEQAKILYQRIRKRGALAPFDPKTLEESIEMVRSCKIIFSLLTADGHTVVTINTLTQPSFDEIESLINSAIV